MLPLSPLAFSRSLAHPSPWGRARKRPRLTGWDYGSAMRNVGPAPWWSESGEAARAAFFSENRFSLRKRPFVCQLPKWQWISISLWYPGLGQALGLSHLQCLWRLWAIGQRPWWSSRRPGMDGGHKIPTEMRNPPLACNWSSTIAPPSWLLLERPKVGQGPKNSTRLSDMGQFPRPVQRLCRSASSEAMWHVCFHWVIFNWTYN